MRAEAGANDMKWGSTRSGSAKFEVWVGMNDSRGRSCDSETWRITVSEFAANATAQDIMSFCQWQPRATFLFRATSPTRLRARGPWPLHFEHTHSWEKAEPVQDRFTLRLRDQRSEWMQDGCKVYMDLSMASNGSCFHGHLDYIQSRLLEVGITQNRETTAIRNLTALQYPAWLEIHWKSIWLSSQWLHTALKGPRPHLHDCRSALGRPLDTSFGLPRFHAHGSWLVCFKCIEIASSLSLFMLLLNERGEPTTALVCLINVGHPNSQLPTLFNM